MKNTIFFSFCFIFLKFITFAQVNLVPNPSFEDTVSCPNSGGQVGKARYWKTLFNTPDYFNTCNPYFQFSVPSNSFGYQYPHTGEAYMGLWEYFSWISSSHEIIGADLIAPLVIGQKYYINLKVCLAWNAAYGDNTATNKLGVLFSMGNYLSSTNSNYCQIYSNEIISDSIYWTTIRGSFIADSEYTLISISNFFDDINIDTFHLNYSNSYQAYYYLDDVCVSTDSVFTEVWTSIPIRSLKENIVLYPNPAKNQIILDNLFLNCKRIDIYDFHGKRVKSIATDGNYKITIDISTFIEGIYSVILNNQKSVLIKQFVKSNN